MAYLGIAKARVRDWQLAESEAAFPVPCKSEGLVVVQVIFEKYTVFVLGVRRSSRLEECSPYAKPTPVSRNLRVSHVLFFVLRPSFCRV